MRQWSIAKVGFGLAALLSANGTIAVARALSPLPSDLAPAGVRMVRLSAVRGKVELDRGTRQVAGRGFEAGFTNLPIVQGNRLRTVGLGWAEVEFEDGGTARITPDTQVDFNTLSRTPDGQLENTLNLQQGTLYVSRMKDDKSGLLVITGGKKINLPAGSHVRLDVYPAGSELVVVKGNVRVEDESGMATMVDRSHALRFGGTAETQIVEAKNESPGLYDRWDAQAAEYHQALMARGGSAYQSGNGAGGLYGLRDMQYYGSFVNMDGCGQMWRPYLASAAFDPAASGVWAWYPGAGYTFVSPYAWGWTSFNSGSWASCGTQGWGWRPGAWVGLKNHGIVEPIKGPGHHPRPLDEPAVGRPTVVNAGEHALSHSVVNLAGASQFERDSAGAGIPRGAVGNLKEISKAVLGGKPAPEPSYRGDPVAIDPVALTLLAQKSEAGSRTTGSAGGRGIEVAGTQGQPIARPVLAGGRGGYTAGGSSFAAVQGNVGGQSSLQGGGRSAGATRSTTISAGPSGSSGASSGSKGGSSTGSPHH